MCFISVAIARQLRKSRFILYDGGPQKGFSVVWREVHSLLDRRKDSLMPVRVAMCDIGGILEVIPEGGDPATRFPALDEEWNTRLGLPPGRLTQCVEAIEEEGVFGQRTYEEWYVRLQTSTGMSQADLDAYMAAFWDI
jgi:hypothetical protein